MSRPTLRRNLRLESLETRQVLSTVPGVGPTADQQYALELINLVRTNPAEAAQDLTSNITPDVQATLNYYGLSVQGLVSELDQATPQPPLAWSDSLASAAQSQSNYEAANDIQTHTGPDGSSLSDRINNAGYANASTYGENTFAYADSIDEAMQSFLFDWGVADHGHYNNLLQPGVSAEGSFKDVGIGLAYNANGQLVITQDFGSQQGEGPQIVGSVFGDPNQTGHFASGSGVGGVSIDAVNVSTGTSYQTQTWGSGGYQLAVPANGQYQVTATANGQVIGRQTVQVGDVNAQVQFDQDMPIVEPEVQVDIPVITQAPTPTPAPAPAPAPTPAPAPPVSHASVEVAPVLQLDSAPEIPTSPSNWLTGWTRRTAAVATGD